VVSRLVLILGDQLSEDIRAAGGRPRADTVVMAEVMDEASYVPHHPKKIAFLFAAMRKFAARLEGRAGACGTPGSTIRTTRAPSPVS
jgi:deoxyribodipyrimidine photolyase-related protein